MSIYLIRHTTPVITQEYCYGHMDIDVAEDFEELAIGVENKINLAKTDIVYASPLIRSAKLAQRLYPEKEIIYTDNIKEMNFGDWEGEKWANIGKEALTNWTNNFETHAAPNGESLMMFYNRVMEFWDSVDLSQKTAIVSHAGTMRMIISRLLEIPLHRSFSIGMKYAQVIKLTPWDSKNCHVEFL